MLMRAHCFERAWLCALHKHTRTCKKKEPHAERKTNQTYTHTRGSNVSGAPFFGGGSACKWRRAHARKTRRHDGAASAASPPGGQKNRCACGVQGGGGRGCCARWHTVRALRVFFCSRACSLAGQRSLTHASHSPLSRPLPPPGRPKKRLTEREGGGHRLVRAAAATAAAAASAAAAPKLHKRRLYIYIYIYMQRAGSPNMWQGVALSCGSRVCPPMCVMMRARARVHVCMRGWRKEKR